MASKAGNKTTQVERAKTAAAEPVDAASDTSAPAKRADAVVPPPAKAPAATKAPAAKARVAPKPVAAKPVAKSPDDLEKRPAAAPVEPVPAKPVDPIIKAAESVVTTAAQAAVSTAQKEQPIMATAYDAPKFEAPKMFNDFNDRAKSAVEKSTQAFEDANEMTKGNVEALVESSKIAAKGFETLGQNAADYGRKSFESMTATLKNLAAIKSPADFFKLQSDYAREAFDAAVAQSSKTTETMIKLAGDAAQPIQNRFSVVADKVKSAA